MMNAGAINCAPSRFSAAVWSAAILAAALDLQLGLAFAGQRGRAVQFAKIDGQRAALLHERAGG